MQNLIIVGIGGFIGSNLRYYSSKFFLEHFGPSFPYGTLFVNVLGSFILGFITIYATQVIDADPRVRLFIGTGMMGALTTFSTFSVETVNLIQESNYSLAFANVAMNMALGFVAVLAGFTLAKSLG